MKIGRTTVDGVPTFWTEGDRDGYHALLMFRVGNADETLARSGITHLVEHLALHRVGQPEHHYNGTVDATMTSFFTHGDGGEVIRFLDTVCSSLRDLPLDRLEAEKQILRTESASRPGGPAAAMVTWRYGAATYGLRGYDELGLAALTGDAVQEWTRTWFTRGNAVLALVGGPPPEGLRLDLPDGPRRAAPTRSRALPETPAYFTGEINGVGLSAEVPRSAAAAVYATILQRRLHRVLRLDEAVSYTTNVDCAAQDGDVAYITAYADGLDEHRKHLVRTFLDEIENSSQRLCEPAELAEAITIHRNRLTGREGAGGLVGSACWDELMGKPVRDADMRSAELDAVTAEAVRQAANDLRRSALVMLPPGCEPHLGHYVEAPSQSTVAVQGELFQRVDPQASQLHLIIGSDGVTSLTGPSMSTVRYDSCAAVLAWPDGARVLVGQDAMSVQVEPNRWIGGGVLTALIDPMVPPQLMVPMPARPADQIPEPDHTAVPRPAPAPPAEPRVPPLIRLLRRLRELGPAWDDPALTAVLAQVRAGDLPAGHRLLAQCRDEPELRALRVTELAQAATGRGGDLARLCAARPGDADLSLWYGATLVKEAWKVRTSYRAEHIDGERFGAFWAALAAAGGPLHQAAELLPHDPVPWNELQWYAIGMQLGRPELDSIWTELHRRAPHHFAGQYTRVQALCKKWWGSDDEVVEFAESMALAAPPGDPTAAVLCAAHLENAADLEGDGAEGYMALPEVYGPLAAAADKWLAEPSRSPRGREADHLFGAVFWWAGDFDRARVHLARTGRTMPDRLPWGYENDPAATYRMALRDLKLRMR